MTPAMRSLVAFAGVLLLLAAIARMIFPRWRWLLFWWRLRLWLALIGIALVVAAAGTPSTGQPERPPKPPPTSIRKR